MAGSWGIFRDYAGFAAACIDDDAVMVDAENNCGPKNGTSC